MSHQAQRRRFLWALAVLSALQGAGCTSSKPAPPVTPTQAASVPATNSTTPSAAPAASGTTAPSLSKPSEAGEAPNPNVTSDFVLAKKQIDETIAKSPKDHNLRMRAAEFYMKTGHYADAIPHLQAATQISPDKPLAWIALGDAAAFAGKYPTAEQAYARAEKLDPHNAFAVRGLGQLRIMQRKFPEARKVLEQGLKQHPSDVELSTALGNLYLILNKPHDAVKILAPVVAKVSDRPDLNYMLGEAYERDLHIEAAILQMQEVVRLDPGNAQAWGRIGLYQNNLTRYREARTALQHAIALEPNGSYFHWALGDSYLLENTSAENFAQAQQEYKKALELDPKNQKALYSYGMGLTRRGEKPDLEEALGLFQRLIALNPKDMNAHFKLYETYKRLGRTAEAEAHRAKFKDLFAKGRNQTRSLYAGAAFVDTAQSHLKRGDEAMKAQNYALAATEYQLALERDRNLDAARKGMLTAQKKQQESAKTGAAP